MSVFVIRKNGMSMYYVEQPITPIQYCMYVFACVPSRSAAASLSRRVADTNLCVCACVCGVCVCMGGGGGTYKCMKYIN